MQKQCVDWIKWIGPDICVEGEGSRETQWGTTRPFCFPVKFLNLFLQVGQVELIHISDWILINLQFQFKTQMTKLHFHRLHQHRLIFCQVLIKEAESQERMRFNAAVSGAMGTHSCVDIKKIIAVPSGCIDGSHLGRNAHEDMGYCK